jgi:hypothetical protein
LLPPTGRRQLVGDPFRRRVRWRQATGFVAGRAP